MYQVAFAVAEFPRLVPWLMLNRDGLDVLVHPLSGDSLADHTRFAMWLGRALPLRLESLRPTPAPAEAGPYIRPTSNRTMTITSKRPTPPLG